MQAGIAFEREIIRWLRMVGCYVSYDERRDYYEQVDLTIHRIDDQRLPVPAEIQLTMQGGNLQKLEHYLKNRSGKSSCHHFYVVAPHNIREPIAGGQIIEFVTEKCLSGTPSSFLHGVFLKTNGKYDEFDLNERLIWLRKRADPTASADQRSVGWVTELRDGGFSIQTKKGKKTKADPWFALYNDIAENELRYLLQGLRKKGLQTPQETIKVSFYRHTTRRRKKALSIISSRE